MMGEGCHNDDMDPIDKTKCLSAWQVSGILDVGTVQGQSKT